MVGFGRTCLSNEEYPVGGSKKTDSSLKIWRRMHVTGATQNAHCIAIQDGYILSTE